jgi:hypothetical protein
VLPLRSLVLGSSFTVTVKMMPNALAAPEKGVSSNEMLQIPDRCHTLASDHDSVLVMRPVVVACRVENVLSDTLAFVGRKLRPRPCPPTGPIRPQLPKGLGITPVGEVFSIFSSNIGKCGIADTGSGDCRKNDKLYEASKHWAADTP